MRNAARQRPLTDFLVRSARTNDVMQTELTSERRVFLSTGLAGRREVRCALAAVLVSGVIFFAELPFASQRLTEPCFWRNIRVAIGWFRRQLRPHKNMAPQ